MKIAERKRGDLRRKLSQLKAEAQTRKGASRRNIAFRIEKEGAGQVVVVGVTNVGKSALVAALTNANPEVSEQPYTTWVPTPGMMPIEDVQVQLIDTPPLDRNAIEPELINLIRRADLVLVVVDLQADPLQQLEEATEILAEHRIVSRRLADRYRDQPRLVPLPMLVVVNKNDDERTDGDWEVLRELLADEWDLVPVSAATRQ